MLFYLPGQLLRRVVPEDSFRAAGILPYRWPWRIRQVYQCHLSWKCKIKNLGNRDLGLGLKANLRFLTSVRGKRVP